MIRTLSAFTEEMDDIELAISEIKQQLERQELLAHSIGLVSCLPAFLETGVYAALVEALPFDIVGQTTIAGAELGSSSLDILSLFVITSDELEFSIGLAGPVTAEGKDTIANSYRETLAQVADKPPVSLIIAYAPLLLTVSGDYFIRAFDEATGGIPVFGSLAIDNTIDYHNSRVLFREEEYVDYLAYVLVHGVVKPRYYLATISDEKISSGTGVVTKSQGNQVMEIDGAPALQFLLSKGLATDDEGVIQGLNSFPYIVDFNDGTDSAIRVIFAMTDEGSAVCLGDIPEGATLSVGYFDDEDILRSTRTELRQLPIGDPSDPGASSDLDTSAINGILIFSCLGRYLNLGFESDREVAEVRARLDQTGIPYAIAYSGGEMCPLGSHTDSSKLTNRFHNSTFIMLVL
ncbi:MAG: FIST C-terminal domain-containing protein [Coriobacteriales bacterium]|jgi:hypothetical protein|nr:FIST C-terminal domain-containing protein [Coriobacteriales bacterium]